MAHLKTVIMKDTILEQSMEGGYVHQLYISNQDACQLTENQIERRESIGASLVPAGLLLVLVACGFISGGSHLGLAIYLLVLAIMAIGASMDGKYRELMCDRCNKKFQKGDEIETKFSAIKGWHSSNWHKVCL